MRDKQSRQAIEAYVDYCKMSYSNARSFDLLSQKNNIEYIKGLPQQPATTNDCAVFVSYFIERLANRQEIKKDFNEEKIKQYKADMLNKILRAT